MRKTESQCREEIAQKHEFESYSDAQAKADTTLFGRIDYEAEEMFRAQPMSRADQIIEWANKRLALQCKELDDAQIEVLTFAIEASVSDGSVELKRDEAGKELSKSQISNGVFIFPSHAQISKEALNVYGHKGGREQELNIQKHKSFIQGGIYVLDESCKIYDRAISHIQSQLEAKDREIGKWKEEARDNWKQYLEANDEILMLKSQLQSAHDMILPSDEEVGKWFDGNVGYGKENPSASSAIYKFRLWLKSRIGESPVGALKG